MTLYYNSIDSAKVIILALTAKMVILLWDSMETKAQKISEYITLIVDCFTEVMI